eukprot:GHVT01025509.1.p1 GENE.GHVT01025509.1~~GHVT01025509.1.p1  ORF type:complete len:916 (+),score=71.55 GHVT01025509.1:521-3268(+)
MKTLESGSRFAKVHFNDENDEEKPPPMAWTFRLKAFSDLVRRGNGYLLVKDTLDNLAAIDHLMFLTQYFANPPFEYELNFNTGGKEQSEYSACLKWTTKAGYVQSIFLGRELQYQAGIITRIQEFGVRSAEAKRFLSYLKRLEIPTKPAEQDEQTQTEDEYDAMKKKCIELSEKFSVTDEIETRIIEKIENKSYNFPRVVDGIGEDESVLQDMHTGSVLHHMKKQQDGQIKKDDDYWEKWFVGVLAHALFSEDNPSHNDERNMFILPSSTPEEIRLTNHSWNWGHGNVCVSFKTKQDQHGMTDNTNRTSMRWLQSANLAASWRDCHGPILRARPLGNASFQFVTYSPMIDQEPKAGIIDTKLMNEKIIEALQEKYETRKEKFPEVAFIYNRLQSKNHLLGDDEIKKSLLKYASGESTPLKLKISSFPLSAVLLEREIVKIDKQDELKDLMTHINKKTVQEFYEMKRDAVQGIKQEDLNHLLVIQNDEKVAFAIQSHNGWPGYQPVHIGNVFMRNSPGDRIEMLFGIERNDDPSVAPVNFVDALWKQQKYSDMSFVRWGHNVWESGRKEYVIRLTPFFEKKPKSGSKDTFKKKSREHKRHENDVIITVDADQHTWTDAAKKLEDARKSKLTTVPWLETVLLELPNTIKDPELRYLGFNAAVGGVVTTALDNKGLNLRSVPLKNYSLDSQLTALSKKLEMFSLLANTQTSESRMASNMVAMLVAWTQDLHQKTIESQTLTTEEDNQKVASWNLKFKNVEISSTKGTIKEFYTSMLDAYKTYTPVNEPGGVAYVKYTDEEIEKFLVGMRTFINCYYNYYNYSKHYSWYNYNNYQPTLTAHSSPSLSSQKKPIFFFKLKGRLISLADPYLFVLLWMVARITMLQVLVQKYKDVNDFVLYCFPSPLYHTKLPYDVVQFLA